MIQMICIGWVLGIATMGKTFPLLQLWLVPSIALFILTLLLKLTVLKHVQRLYFEFLQLCIAFCLGITLGYHYAELQLNERLQFREQQPEVAEVIGYVKNLNELGDHSIQQKIQILNRHTEVVQWQAFLKNAADADSSSVLELGQYYRLHGQILPAHSYATEGAFDQEQWYIQQNIMSGFRVSAIEKLSQQQVAALSYGRHLRQQGSVSNQIQLWVEQQRLALRNFINQQPVQHKGLMLALLTGDKSLLDPETEQLFQRFGMSHLLAISGPHVLIFAVLLCWSLHQFISRYRPQIYLKWPKQYLLIWPFCASVALYCAFVGFEIPALRTLLSCVLISLFILFKQKVRALNILLFSASILLIFDPFSILSAAFWLSYGACFVLLRIYQTVQQQSSTDKLKSRIQSIKMQLKLLIESQWKIFLALFPLMMLFFKQIAWITPLSNLFAIPWIGLVIVPLDLLAALCYFIAEPLGGLVFQLNDLCLAALLWLLQLLDWLFAPTLQPIAMNFAVWLSLCLGLMILFLPRAVLPKAWAVLCFVPLITLDASKNEFELNVLDVGQGQAIFIRDQDQTLMIDMGGNYDEAKFSIGKQIILPFLSVKGVHQLDQLVLTHLDLDHYGAYQSIKHDLAIKQVYSNEQIEIPSSSQFDYCRQGLQWHWKNHVDMTVLSPKAENLAYAKAEKNEMSCVIYLQVKNAQPYQNFLLMADAGWKTEYQILQDYPDLKVDVLVLGHHGSQHSSAYAFLKQLKPKLAIASAGFNNRYGHPSKMTLQRLRQLDIPLLTTVQQGSIQFTQQADGQMQLHYAREHRQWLNRTTPRLQ
ncbi:DNA internalization-related competence protein ComEC/Rec2 [Acinetobacter sp.]|uniref:DNA internalization-related competence protein ComEC/Rec2 n=1 Tax=Acinetobacter sp. TaxID=472 RepID=UPI002647980B|nr:DNA internalization-related competence protein ComEC/Rec2 [Acinetobacter sp.]MDN5511420.1 DNA internalization-related competence protein ComEC/Rec2 [Acinetobacter sp.]MDN5524673.1 DNA internalization-related competence protein ComEC/Rec2 [Acinetobacter sp.]